MGVVAVLVARLASRLLGRFLLVFLVLAERGGLALAGTLSFFEGALCLFECLLQFLDHRFQLSDPLSELATAGTVV